MRTSMVTQDADTFVALGRAVGMAAAEGALSPDEAADLSTALVAGILSGSMDLDTYTRVHEALARLLDRAFAQGSGEVGEASPAPAGAENDEEPLGVYLQVVGDAWDCVSPADEVGARLRRFVSGAFVVARARFGEGAWFRAPLRVGSDELIRRARAAGLLVVSIQGPPVGPGAEARLMDPESPPGPTRIVLGWGEQRTALDLSPA